MQPMASTMPVLTLAPFLKGDGQFFFKAFFETSQVAIEYQFSSSFLFNYNYFITCLKFGIS